MSPFALQTSTSRRTPWLLAALILALGGVAWLATRHRVDAPQKSLSTDSPADAASPQDTDGTPAADEADLTVTLPPEKLKAVQLHSIEVNRQFVQPTRTVPGKIGYRSIRRVDIKAPVDSVVHQVLVKPGDAVQSGSRLALLDSPEIGLARAELERNRADLVIATQARDWADQMARNLDDLLKFLESTPKPQQVETEFEEKVLGDHRQHLLSAYSRFHLANELYADIQPLAEKGAVSVQTVKQRESNREVAKAEFRGIVEQSRFDAAQQRKKAVAAMQYAGRIVEVSRQKLRTLLGEFSELAEAPETTSPTAGELTRFYLIAPFEGTVEQRHVAAAQRLSAGTLLYVVADTRELEVAADIRERDWQALSLREGSPVQVRVPALGGREFTAHVDYVGRAVSPDTQAVPLVAILQNPDHLLRPGMFVWVALPLGRTGEELVIPPSALLSHEGKKFVFVEESPSRFRRVDVTTGAETETWVAITHGLVPSQKVVDRGAFLLKSELLLEPEED